MIPSLFEDLGADSPEKGDLIHEEKRWLKVSFAFPTRQNPAKPLLC